MPPDTDRPEAEAQKYPNIVRFVRETPWAILESKLQDITELIAMRSAGLEFTEEEIAARIGAGPARRQAYMTDGQIAVIPVYGVITPRADLMSQMSGGTSVQGLQQAIRAAVAEPKVTGILLDVDSPGGSVAMIAEMAAELRQARKTKPVLAIANTMAASAAYWIASQATSFSVTPSGNVGSIGVIAVHDDISEMQAKLGVKSTMVTAGRFKGEMSPFAPLTEEAQAQLQTTVDKFYAMFTTDVARGRGVPIESVRAEFGQGRMLLAKDALAAGMVDQIETYDQALSRLESGKVTAGARISAVMATNYTGTTTNTFEDGSWALEEPPEPEPPDEPDTDTEDLEAAESGLSFADEADALRASAEGLVTRAASLAEVEHGRLTVSKRDRLTACSEALRESATAMDAVVATRPAKRADAFGLMEQRLQFERHRAEL